MNEGLFPKRSFGWVLLALLSVLYYSVYYDVLYSQLHQRYTTQYSSPRILSCHDELDVKILVPKTISEYTEEVIRVELINNSKSTIPYLGINVQPIITDFQKVIVSSTRSNLYLNQDKDNNILPTFLEFESIPPEGTTSGLFWIYVRNIVSSESDINLRVSCFSQEDLIDTDDVRLTYDPQSSLIRGFISTILLPPWSNILLLVLSLLGIKIVEDQIPYMTDENGECLNKSYDEIAARCFAVLFLLFGYSLVVYYALIAYADISPNIIYLLLGIIFLLIGYVIYFLKLNQICQKNKQLKMMDKCCLGDNNLKTETELKAKEQEPSDNKKDDSQKIDEKKRKRRHFSGEYKRRIVEEYDSSTEEQKKSPLKRENIPLNHISRLREKIASTEHPDEDDKNLDSEEPSLEETGELGEQTPDDSSVETPQVEESSEPEFEVLNLEELENCPACGEEITPDDTSCPHCGTFLKGPEDTSSENGD